MSLSRRELIALLASQGLAAKWRLPLGFTLYGMLTMPLEDGLRACARIGYDAVELALMPGWPTEPKLLSSAARRQLRGRLGELGLNLAALMENLSVLTDDAGHAANLDRLRRACELAHDLSPDNPPVIETILGGKPGEWDAIRMRVAERVAEWGRVMTEHGVVLAVKPHVGNAMRTPEAVLWLLEQVKNPLVRAAYDYSHYQAQNMEMRKTMDMLLPSTSFIHLKDTRLEAERREWRLPGDGTVDYAEYAAALERHRYDKPVVVEVSSQIFNRPGYDPVAAARRCYDKLSHYFGTRRKEGEGA